MDVLQLLGVSYLVARAMYELPRYPRAAAAIGLLLWHWAFLKSGYQGEHVPRGTFEAVRDAAIGRMVEHSAVKYAYDHWGLWGGQVTSWLNVNWIGLLSVPPAAGMMLLGTFAGDWMRDKSIDARARTARLTIAGGGLALAGVMWAFDLPMNKPRWTSAYLVYCAGVGFLALALLHWLIDLRRCGGPWTIAFVALGVNAIAAYWVTIMFKVLVLNLPRIRYGGETMSLTDAIIRALQDAFGSAWIGGWAFTLLFVAFWWAILLLAHSRMIIWKI
jgi:predicted acyltransferase